MNIAVGSKVRWVSDDNSILSGEVKEIFITDNADGIMVPMVRVMTTTFCYTLYADDASLLKRQFEVR